MARHLEQRADYIRTFAAQVSHEFKTPLAAMRGAVELLRNHLDTMTAAERERFLSHLDQDAARLERLVRRLLELARADVMQASATDRAEVAAVVRRLAARYQDAGLRGCLKTALTKSRRCGCRSPLAGDFNGLSSASRLPQINQLVFRQSLKVTVVEPLPSVNVAMTEDVLESILSNLLDNARQHGGDAVTVAVTLPAPLSLLIEVSDNGPGISAANAARMFEPFFTTARARGGTGLGLAVVKSLLAAHRGTIELGESAAGTRLRISLPLGAAARSS